MDLSLLIAQWSGQLAEGSADPGRRRWITQMRVSKEAGTRFPLRVVPRGLGHQNAQKRPDALDAATIDEFATEPDRTHNPLASDEADADNRGDHA